MDLQPLGTGTPLFDAALRAAAAGLKAARTGAAAPPANLSDDTIAALLDRLAAPGVANLILSLEDRRAALDSGALEELVRVMGDPDSFTRAVEELVKQHPEWPARLRAEPRLAEVAKPLASVLERLALEARLRAATTIALADEGIRMAEPRGDADEIASARTVLDLAGRLVEVEEHASYVRAEELASVLLEHFPVTPPPVTVEAPAAEVDVPADARWRAAIAQWWKRAPVLVMIGGWFAAGALMALLSLVFSWNPRGVALLWAGGCLAFVVWIRIRSLRV